MKMLLKRMLPEWARGWLRSGVNAATLWWADARVRLAGEEKLTRRLLRAHRRKWDRDWSIAGRCGRTVPSFTDHRAVMFQFGFGRRVLGADLYSRAFYTSEVIRSGDRVLDIGCGDGFLTKRFYSPRAALVEAIDIDASAIRACRRYQAAPNITYHCTDAVSEPFPSSQYDVIVWDGAIGHFTNEDSRTMLRKIAAALAPGGIFCGSESLGHSEGHDHLQFFEDCEDIRALFRPWFKSMDLRQRSFWTYKPRLLRTEAYWRCVNDGSRLEECRWH